MTQSYNYIANFCGLETVAYNMKTHSVVIRFYGKAVFVGHLADPAKKVYETYYRLDDKGNASGAAVAVTRQGQADNMTRFLAEGIVGPDPKPNEVATIMQIIDYGISAAIEPNAAKF